MEYRCGTEKVAEYTATSVYCLCKGVFFVPFEIEHVFEACIQAVCHLLVERSPVVNLYSLQGETLEQFHYLQQVKTLLRIG